MTAIPIARSSMKPWANSNNVPWIRRCASLPTHIHWRLCRSHRSVQNNAQGRKSNLLLGRPQSSHGGRKRTFLVTRYDEFENFCQGSVGKTHGGDMIIRIHIRIELSIQHGLMFLPFSHRDTIRSKFSQRQRPPLQKEQISTSRWVLCRPELKSW